MKRLLLAERALDDLSAIYEYSLSEFGEKTALEYMRGFEESFGLLKHNPGLLKTNKRISSSFILYPVQRHFLICDIINDAICVLTIKHTSLNLLERLRKLEPALDDEVKALFARLKKQN